MRKLIILPTSELFRELLMAMHDYDRLSINLMTWGEAALWAVGCRDADFVSDRIDNVVGDFTGDAAAFEYRGVELERFSMTLYMFCEGLRTLLMQTGLVASESAKQYVLPPTSPLTLHLLQVDERLCMHVEATLMGLPPSLVPVVDSEYETTSTHSRDSSTD